jgi:DNA-binding NarL/FixJ family response regulator
MNEFSEMASFRDDEMPMGRDPVRALLLDDDRDDVMIIQTLTARSKQIELQVRATRSIVDARMALAETRFDILFVDYWLGAETSIAFIHEVTQTENIPCILMTGLDTPEIRRCAFRAGVAGFLAKDDISIQAIDGVTLTALRQGGRMG